MAFFSAKFSVIFLLLTLLLGTQSNCVNAQFPLIYCSDVVGNYGENFEVQFFINNSFDDIQAWSFGACHNSSDLNLFGVRNGATTLVSNNGSMPDFVEIDIFPEDGFAVGVVICFQGCAVLPIGTIEAELHVATYEWIGVSGPLTTIEFCESLPSSFYEAIVVINGVGITPITQSANVGIGLFVRADVNGDACIDIGDAVTVLAYLFTGGSIGCEKSSDSNDDGLVDIADGILILTYLFNGAGDLPTPFPNCGIDPSGDSLSCLSYPGC